VADPLQGVLDLLGLDRDLALVGQHLPRGARMRGDRLDALGPASSSATVRASA
jgi:hypothetical protein